MPPEKMLLVLFKFLKQVFKTWLWMCNLVIDKKKKPDPINQSIIIITKHFSLQTINVFSRLVIVYKYIQCLHRSIRSYSRNRRIMVFIFSFTFFIKLIYYTIPEIIHVKCSPLYIFTFYKWKYFCANLKHFYYLIIIEVNFEKLKLWMAINLPQIQFSSSS